MTLPLSYNLRNLFVRKLSTSLTLLVVAVVVGVLTTALSFGAGIRTALRASGSPRNILILKPGATAESTSIIPLNDANPVVQTPGIARNDAGELLVSRELCVQTSLTRKAGDGGLANVAVRGVEPIAFEVHPEMHIVAGRMFNPAAQEAIVGRAAAKRYEGLELGRHMTIGRAGNRDYQIVGIFECGGSAFESEIWAPRTILADSFKRLMLSSIVVRLDPSADAEAAITYINGPAVVLEARRETAYYDELSEKMRQFVWVSTVLVAIMAGGAAFAVANTLFASVDRRRREIAMLRCLGFTRRSIVVSFLLESLLICGAACGVGVGGALLGMWLTAEREQDFLSNETWTVLAYEMRVTPDVAIAATVTALLVGILGALAPALRAGRTQIIEALRKA